MVVRHRRRAARATHAGGSRSRRLAWVRGVLVIGALGTLAGVTAWRTAPAANDSTTVAPRVTQVPVGPSISGLVVSPATLIETDPVRARLTNSTIPMVGGGPASARFVLPVENGGDTALQCLARAVYYEARNESATGQRAVAQVVLNRVRHPAFPATVCGVVYQGSERRTGCQFTFTCDGAETGSPADRGKWQQALGIARAALAGTVEPTVGWATHYHADYVVPYWATSLDKAAQLGTHIFYRWRNGWGRAPAFAQRHSGVEIDLRAAVVPILTIDPAELVAGETLLASPGEMRRVTPKLLADEKPDAIVSDRSVVAADRPGSALRADLLEKPVLRADARTAD